MIALIHVMKHTHIYMQIYIYIYIYIYTYTHTLSLTHTRTQTRTHTHTHKHKRVMFYILCVKPDTPSDPPADVLSPSFVNTPLHPLLSTHSPLRHLQSTHAPPPSRPPHSSVQQWQECAQAAWTQAALRNCTLKPL